MSSCCEWSRFLQLLLDLNKKDFFFELAVIKNDGVTSKGSVKVWIVRKVSHFASKSLKSSRKLLFRNVGSARPSWSADVCAGLPDQKVNIFSNDCKTKNKMFSKLKTQPGLWLWICNLVRNNGHCSRINFQRQNPVVPNDYRTNYEMICKMNLSLKTEPGLGILALSSYTIRRTLILAFVSDGRLTEAPQKKSKANCNANVLESILEFNPQRILKPLKALNVTKGSNVIVIVGESKIRFCDFFQRHQTEQYCALA